MVILMKETHVRKKLSTVQSWIKEGLLGADVKTGMRIHRDNKRQNCELWIDVPTSEIISSVWFDFLQTIDARLSYATVRGGRLLHFGWLTVELDDGENE